LVVALVVLAVVFCTAESCPDQTIMHSNTKPAKTAPKMPPLKPGVREITVWDDDRAHGKRECARLVEDYGPAMCHVEPESMAPDPSKPGWARDW
jgi:hypothetical protein